MFVTVITFLIILSILVLVHELGHFFTARFFGVDVEEFGIGLPPKLVGKKIKGTEYTINALPIGGFVRLKGEDEENPEQIMRKTSSLKEYFWARSKKERALILASGVGMNFFLAVILTAFLLTQGVSEPSGRVHIENVANDSPAEQAGIMKGDIVKTFRYHESTLNTDEIFEDAEKSVLYETKPFTSTQDLIRETKNYIGREIILVIERNGEDVLVPVIPRANPPEGQGPMGVTVSDLEEVRYPWYSAPFVAIKINLLMAKEMLFSIANNLWKLISFTRPKEVQIAGPIGIAQVTGRAVEYGFRAVLEFMAILSLNLAVLNLLPIPALDGGRLLFIFIEKVLGRRVRPAFEKSTHQIGMIILFAILLLVSVNDIMRLARGG